MQGILFHSKPLILNAHRQTSLNGPFENKPLSVTRGTIWRRRTSGDAVCNLHRKMCNRKFDAHPLSKGTHVRQHIYNKVNRIEKLNPQSASALYVPLLLSPERRPNHSIPPPASDSGKARPQAATKAALSQTKAHSTSLLLKGEAK